MMKYQLIIIIIRIAFQFILLYSFTISRCNCKLFCNKLVGSLFNKKLKNKTLTTKFIETHYGE